MSRWKMFIKTLMMSLVFLTIGSIFCSVTIDVVAAPYIDSYPALPKTENTPATTQLQDIDSGLTSPSGDYRWRDVADQLFSDSYRSSYNYTQASVQVSYDNVGNTLKGTLTAVNLKPNFAYQLKLAGAPGTSTSERIGLAGRWWQEEWNGSQWTNGQNLNDKGDGSTPSPNDNTYFSRCTLTDSTSPTGLKYRYTGYLVFDYFITDQNGDVTLDFETDSSYHVLWKTSQRTRSSSDGPLKTSTFDPDLLSSAYDTDYGQSTVSIFGEWERLPEGGIYLQPGDYSCQLILTEESFHGSGGTFAGNWAAAMGGDIEFSIIPTSVNDPPDAVDDTVTIDEDSTNNTIDVLANDSDPDGDELTIDSITQGSHGMVTGSGSDVTYTPDAGYSGSDSFSYTVSDGKGGSDTATVTITINPVNDVPVASDDSATTDEDTAVNIDVLGNDSDPDGDSLSIDSVSTPSNGEAAIETDNTITYTPNNGFSGNDSFNYTVSDGNGGSDTATVSITVVSVEPPLDQTATGEISSDGTVVGTYIDTQANDSVIESITERTTGGKPSGRESFLNHEWSFDVRPGEMVTFFANTWASQSSDGDTFVFSYSTDGISFKDMFTITTINDDNNYYVYTLPNTLSGVLFVRLADTDQTPGNQNKDTVYVDHLFVRTNKVPSQLPSPPTDLTASLASSSQIELNWTDNANNELGYYIERYAGTNDWEQVGLVGVDITTYSDIGLDPEVIYHYRVQAYNLEGTSSYSNEETATTGSASTVNVSDMDGDSLPGNKNRWNATVIITIVDAYGSPVSGAVVTGVWSNGINGTASCVTDVNGQGIISKANIKDSISKVSFIVTDVEYPPYTYNPDRNSDPDNDSDGTSIVINSPS